MSKLVFGEITLKQAEQRALVEGDLLRGFIVVNGKEYDRRLVNQKPLHNPCLDVFGAGPDDARCTSCAHLELHNGGSQNYYKCNLWPITGGPGTDHRLNWPACAKYEGSEA